ncbi:hypothetical protein [Hanstruepera ponticola]|uniref:hypothetical protein n=1 Tax=Hanstruepera ponticola TaxID=2042995 RepID=UPI001F432659|nr:hypothetical protein [Hanstruepera ponticola]
MKSFLINYMERIVLLICLLLLAAPVLQAQVDGSNNTTIIPAETNQSDGDSSLDIKPLDNKGLSNPNSNRINGMSVPNTSSSNNSEFSMFPKEKFGNPGEIYSEKLKKQEKKHDLGIEGQTLGAVEDQYLGDFKTKSKKVTIAYKDGGGVVDGDRIRVFADEDIIRAEVLLSYTMTGFELELKEGFNKLDFQALNEGEASPNTAEVLILDEGGNVIAHEYWALATGVKATIIVVKE